MVVAYSEEQKEDEGEEEGRGDKPSISKISMLLSPWHFSHTQI